MNYLFNKNVLLALMVIGTASATASVTAAESSKETSPASFQEAILAGKSLTNFRLRYEYVDEDGKAENADAWTLRSLIGWQTNPYHGWSVAAQVIGVSPFNDEYNNKDRGVNEPGKTNYPAVVDPDNYDINQLFVEWSGIPDTKVRLGRQSVKLDNVRFIGNIEFRQVMQVFDGVALENKSVPNTDIYLAHFERVKQINTLLRDANVEIANVKYKLSPTESLSGYAYFVDWASDIVAATASTTSNKTLGLRLDGTHKIDSDWSLLYTAEYAKQDDYKNGSVLIDNYYYRLGAGATYGTWSLRLDQELLSGNSDGKAFQTQLGTNHLFQGWADLFLVTPAHGIQDTFLTASGKWMGVDLKAEYHWIDADTDFTAGNRYGEEFNISAAYAYNKQVNAKIEYANFREEDQYTSRYRDTEKFWLTVLYSF